MGHSRDYTGAKMKRAFILTTGGHLASALVPRNTEAALKRGDRITVSRDIAYAEGALILRGEHGTVDFVDAASGAVEVLMDRQYPGLAAWRNCVLLEPYGTEDIESSFTRDAPALVALKRVFVVPLPGLLIAALATFLGRLYAYPGHLLQITAQTGVFFGLFVGAIVVSQALRRLRS